MTALLFGEDGVWDRTSARAPSTRAASMCSGLAAVDCLAVVPIRRCARCSPAT